MPGITYSQVWSDHTISVGVPGETTIIKVVSGDTVYYGDPNVSSSTNFGSLTAGQSVTISTPVQYLRSASQSQVQITSSANLLYPQETITIDPVGLILDPAAVTGTWSAAHSTTSAQVDNAFNSSNAQNDSISFDVALGFGTYNLAFNHVKAATSAIATVAVNGVTAGSVDLYNASTTINNVGVVSNIQINQSGVYRISITAATRNASSTGWTLQLGRIQLRQTSPGIPALGMGTIISLDSPAYEFIGAPIQNAGSGFQPIVAAPHTPKGIDSIVTTGTSTGTITINYSTLGAIGIVSFWVVPDETFVIHGISGGASVGTTQAIINCATNGTQTDPTTLNTTNFPNGNFWVGGIFKIR